MPAPLYDALLVLHVASAFIGFGSIAVGGWAARIGLRSRRPESDERLVAFFREGTDWPARVVLLVPLFGLAMLFGGDRSDLPAPWPWAGLGLWLLAVGYLSAVGWPGERRAQKLLGGATVLEEAEAAEFRLACRQMERAAGVASLCFLVAVALMLWQP